MPSIYDRNDDDSFYDSADLAASALSRIATGARQRLGSRLAGMRILSVKMRVVLQRPHAAYSRPLQVSGFNGFQQDAVIERIAGSSNREGGNSLLTLSTFAGITGGFLRPSEAPAAIERVHDESHAVFWIEVSSEGQPSREMVCAVLDDLRGVHIRNGEVVSIDHNARLRVNNVFTLRDVHQTNNRGDVFERAVLGFSSDYAVDPTYVTARNTRWYVQTPHTCIQQAQANRFLKSQHDKDDRSARTAESFVTSNPKPVPMTYRTPAAFVAAIGNAMTQATRLSNDTYVSPTVGANGEDDDDDEDYTRVNQMSQAAGILSGSNPFKMGSFNFQQALSELATSDGNSRSGLHGACFTWGELCAIDGRYHRLNSREASNIFTALLPRESLSTHGITTVAREPRYDDGIWRATGQMQSVAMMLGSMTLALMFEKGIASVSLVITNEIANGDVFISSNGFRCSIGGFNGSRRDDAEDDNVSLAFLAAVDYQRATDDFIQRMEFDVGPEAASTGDGRYHDIYARIVADAMGEVLVHLAMDGSKMMTFPLDAPSSAIWTPTVTNDPSTLHGIAAVVNTVVDGSRERTIGRALNNFRAKSRNNPWGN